VSLGDVDLTSPKHQHQRQHQQAASSSSAAACGVSSSSPGRSKSVEQYAAELDWKPGAAGFVSAANGIARIVRSVMVSAERIHAVLGAVYQGEREHNLRIVRTLKKFKTPNKNKNSSSSNNNDNNNNNNDKKEEPSATKTAANDQNKANLGGSSSSSMSMATGTTAATPGTTSSSTSSSKKSYNPLEQIGCVQVEVLAKQAVKRSHIAHHMLEQVVNPLGRVIKDSKIKLSAIFNKHNGAGSDIVKMGVMVKHRKKEVIDMLNNCKAALKREKEKVLLEHSRKQRAQEESSSLSSLFSKLSTGVSEIVRGNLNDLVKTAESGALVYQQGISKANRRQEKYINKDLPRYLKHYALLCTSITKMTRKALQAGFEFQNKDSTFALLSVGLMQNLNTLNPKHGVPEMIESCLIYYDSVIRTFTCSKWKYELPIHPLKIKNRFRLSKSARQSPSKRDFVVVRSTSKPTTLKSKSKAKAPSTKSSSGRRLRGGAPAAAGAKAAAAAAARSSSRNARKSSRNATKQVALPKAAAAAVAAAGDGGGSSTLIDTRYIDSTEFPFLGGTMDNNKKKKEKKKKKSDDVNEIDINDITGGRDYDEDADPFDNNNNKNKKKNNNALTGDGGDGAGGGAAGAVGGPLTSLDSLDVKMTNNSRSVMSNRSSSPPNVDESLDSNMPVVEGEEQREEESMNRTDLLKKNEILTDLLDDDSGGDDYGMDDALQKEMAAVIAADDGADDGDGEEEGDGGAGQLLSP